MGHVIWPSLVDLPAVDYLYLRAYALENRYGSFIFINPKKYVTFFVFFFFSYVFVNILITQLGIKIYLLKFLRKSWFQWQKPNIVWKSCIDNRYLQTTTNGNLKCTFLYKNTKNTRLLVLFTFLSKTKKLKSKSIVKSYSQAFGF